MENVIDSLNRASVKRPLTYVRQNAYQQILVNAETANNLVLDLNPWEKNRPGEMDVHPQATKWEDGTPVQAFARFFPPKPGYYSGTLALRPVEYPHSHFAPSASTRGLDTGLLFASMLSCSATLAS